ncbi:MAG: hypothetical protein WCU00_07575 [Candidatus Latescibacterota bacterium]
MAYGVPAQPDSDAFIDFAKSIGKIKPLHGVNNGPVARGENADLTGYHAAAGFPYTRLHDVHWPYTDAVDVSTIFPIFDSDPDDPKNYTFAKTDDYLAAIVGNGSQIIYRLGESIEPWTQFHKNPPKDFEKWAKVCVNIIRHYNDGWANGFRYGIRYWEIWNEPEGRSMWTGTQQQYFELYTVTSRAIKSHDRSLKVGGPAAIDIYSDFAKTFLFFCREHDLPLDFFSWHLYTGLPKEITDAVQAARKLLDEHGFKDTESHMNEWRYMSTLKWLRPSDPRKYQEVKEKFARTVGPEGAGFVATVLMLLQDLPIEVTNFYSADTSWWSMFDYFGIPSKTYFAFKAFNELAMMPDRVSCEYTSRNGVVLLAGLSEDKKKAIVLLSCFKSETDTFGVALRNLPWTGNIRVETWWVDDSHDLDLTDEQTLNVKDAVVRLKTPRNGVCVLRLSQ